MHCEVEQLYANSCLYSQVCQTLQLLETSRDRAIQSIAIHIADNKTQMISMTTKLSTLYATKNFYHI
jgi:hypothetical protein